jgi:hypothetical protein
VREFLLPAFLFLLAGLGLTLYFAVFHHLGAVGVTLEQRATVLTDEIGTDYERVCEASRLRLLRIGEADPPLRSVMQEIQKAGQPASMRTVSR